MTTTTTTTITMEVPFRFIQTPCCNTLLYWVNSRFPSFCPECGSSVYPAVKDVAGIVDTIATLQYEDTPQPITQMYERRPWTLRDPKEAWERICDSMLLDTEFTMSKALRVGYPGLTSNNYHKYAKPLRQLFVECWIRTRMDGGVPHIVCVKNFNSTATRETWMLPNRENRLARLIPIPDYPLGAA